MDRFLGRSVAAAFAIGFALLAYVYLNVIEWGDGIYGAYFAASAANVGPAESALLAAAIINPRVLNPADSSNDSS